MVQPRPSTPIHDIDVGQINAGDGNGADIIFNYGRHRTTVSVVPNPRAEGSIEGQLIGLGGRAVSEGDEEYEETVDGIFKVIISAGKDTFDKLTQPGSTLYAPQSLPPALYPQTSTFCLRAASGKLSVVAINPETHIQLSTRVRTMISTPSLILTATSQPIPPNKVILLDSLLDGGGSAVGRVLHGSNELLC